MLALSTLLVLSRAALTADLSPPFYPTDRNRVGYWDVVGASVAYEDYILLVPPVQHRSGGVWSTLPLPYGEWSIDFRLRVDVVGTGGGGFAFWLIEDHGASGTFYGGPTSFRGVCIVGAIFLGPSEQRILRLKLIQSDGSDTHAWLSRDEPADAELPLTNETFDIRLHVSEAAVDIQHGSEVLLNETLKVGLGKAWLGLTAMCDDTTSRIEVIHGRFAVIEYMKMRVGEAEEMQHRRRRSRGHTPPVQERVLRNPTFALMRKEIETVINTEGPLEGEKSVEDVLKVCDEFVDVMSDIATFSEVNDFVRRQLMPYVQGWQRRSFKIIENVERSKELLVDAMERSIALISIFNESVNEMVNKTDRKLVRLHDLLEDLAENRDLTPSVDAKTAWFFNLMLYIAFIEIVFVCVFYVIQGIPAISERLI